MKRLEFKKRLGTGLTALLMLLSALFLGGCSNFFEALTENTATNETIAEETGTYETAADETDTSEDDYEDRYDRYSHWNSKSTPIPEPEFKSEAAKELCEQAKLLADYLRDYGFTFGYASINPAINWADPSNPIDENEKLFSCDRFVGWVLYNCGYTDQPEEYGLCVDGNGIGRPQCDFITYCEEHDFIKVESWEDVEPGDIVFIKYDKDATAPAHVFIHYNWDGETGGLSDLRFDGGSDWRISQEQPYSQSISFSGKTEIFICAYRLPG